MPEQVKNKIIQAQLRIDLAALGENYSYFNRLSGGKSAAVIKANGYGLGAVRCANALYDCGARIFFVAHLLEAIELRKYCNKDIQIYVLNGFFENELPYFQNYNLIPVINNLQQLEIFTSQTHNLKTAIHIDTGMNRLGLSIEESTQNLDKIKKIAPSLIMSHLACGSDKNHPLNQKQLMRFNSIKTQFPDTLFSLAASAGTMLGSEYHFDLTRIGIGLYGSNPMDEGINPLKAVAHLSAPIIQLRKLKEGDTIGYGATFGAQSNMQIAIVALGYADGFLRAASNNGFGYYNGRKCAIIGRVSMDLIAIDISNCTPMPEIGAQIEFLGENAKIDDQATAMNTISYEILTRLGGRFEIV